jgi:hypothetical protein
MCLFKAKLFFSTFNGKFRFRDMTENKNLHSAARPQLLDSNADRIFFVTSRVLNYHAFCNVAVIVKKISSRPKLVATAALFQLLEFHLLRLEWIVFIGRTKWSGLRDSQRKEFAFAGSLSACLAKSFISCFERNLPNAGFAIFHAFWSESSQSFGAE